MSDIGTARVLITGDYSKLAADFSAAQGIAASGAANIGSATATGLKAGTVAAQGLSVSLEELSTVIAQQNAVLSLAIQRNLAHAASIRAANSATHDGVSEIQAVSGALRVFEGNSALRAAERFLTTIPGLGAALQFAFPVVGAIALFEGMSRLLGKSEELKQAEQELATATKAADDAFKQMEDTLDHLNVEHVTAIFGSAAGKGAEKTVLEQQAGRIKVQMDDLRDSINEVAYAEANSLKNYVPFHSNAASIDKIKTVGQQIRDLANELQEVQGRIDATGEDAGRAAAQQAGQLIAARLKALEDSSQREAAIRKQLSQAEIESDHAAHSQAIAGIEGEYNRVIALGEEEKRYQKAKAADEAGYALALRDRTIQYAQEKANAESAGKAKPEQAIIATNAAAEIQKAKEDYTKTVQEGSINVAKAGESETLKVIELNQKLATTLRSSVITAYEDMGATARKVEAENAANTEKDATARVRALEEQAKIAGAIGKGQGEIAEARLKAQYEQEHVHSIQQEITYREQLAAIQDRQYTAELTALEARRSDAAALTDEVEKSRQIADIDARIAALSAQAQSAKIASQGQLDALKQNPLEQLGKEFSSVGIKDVQIQAAKDLAAAVHQVSTGLADAIVHAKGFGQAITAAGKQLATALLSTVIEAGLKRVVGALLSLLPAFATVTSAQAGAAAAQKAVAEASVLTAAGEAAAWAFESVMAALPFPVNVAVAPAVAAATLGQVTAVGSFAEGTSSAPGGLSLIGEKGPELMYIPRGAQIIPNGAFNMPSSGSGGFASIGVGGTGGGGGGNHVHIGSIAVHAHGVSNPRQLAEMAVDQIPAVLKAKSSSFSPYSK